MESNVGVERRKREGLNAEIMHDAVHRLCFFHKFDDVSLKSLNIIFDRTALICKKFSITFQLSIGGNPGLFVCLFVFLLYFISRLVQKHARFFQPIGFRQFAPFHSEFSLTALDLSLSSDWSLSLHWFWFYGTLSKSSLTWNSHICFHGWKSCWKQMMM